MPHVFPKLCDVNDLPVLFSKCFSPIIVKPYIETWFKLYYLQLHFLYVLRLLSKSFVHVAKITFLFIFNCKNKTKKKIKKILFAGDNN